MKTATISQTVKHIEDLLIHIGLQTLDYLARRSHFVPTLNWHDRQVLIVVDEA